MLHDRFTSEEQFRDEFIRPFLNRLGFLSVAELHGSQEFGKDFVFAEVDRFGQMRYYGCQAKHERSIRQGAMVDGLLSQIRQMFEISFALPNSAMVHHISAVYVFNDGEITANAQTQIRGLLRREHYGDNAHFLDGQRLEDSSQWARYQEYRDIRQRLSGLLAQAHLNARVWQFIAESAKQQGRTVMRSFTHGIEEMLTNPPPGDLLNTETLLLLWTEIAELDGRITAQAGKIFSLGDRTEEFAAIEHHALTAIRVNNDLIRQISHALERVKPI